MPPFLKKIIQALIVVRYKFKLTPVGQVVLFWPKNFFTNLGFQIRKLLNIPAKGAQVPPYTGPEPKEFEHYLSIFVRCFNEGIYLDEFIAFHLAMGVDHIYIYDNASKDNTAEVLKPWVERGVVTHVLWPNKPPSPTADVDCVVRCRDKTRWLMCIDADEFVFPVEGDSLVPILQEFEAHKGISVANLFFGSSNHEKRPDGLVIEAYTGCGDKLSRNVKSIIDPRSVILNKNSHYWIHKGWSQCVDENHKPIQGGSALHPTANKIRLNHYYSKSLEDYLMKSDPNYFVDTWAKLNNTRNEAKAKESMSRYMEAENRDIQRFIEATKAKLREFQD
ncbi:MAG: glycosyltransferase family 92 protein [Armatimonadetes bacterium]|nr:glycosyltransferase family 92 protein [Armatimonadota bacterium]